MYKLKVGGRKTYITDPSLQLFSLCIRISTALVFFAVSFLLLYKDIVLLENRDRLTRKPTLSLPIPQNMFLDLSLRVPIAGNGGRGTGVEFYGKGATSGGLEGDFAEGS